jgi:hypothetical protein
MIDANAGPFAGFGERVEEMVEVKAVDTRERLGTRG